MFGHVKICFKACKKGKNEMASLIANTICERLEERSNHNPDSVAVSFLHGKNLNEVHTLTYGAMSSRVKRLSSQLLSMRPAGTHVLLFLQTDLDFLTSFLAVLRAGMIAVPLYPPHPKKSLTYLSKILVDCQTNLALCNESSIAKLRRLFEKEPALKELDIHAVHHGTIAGPSEPRILPHLDSESIAFVQYTSGSTDDPKGVLISHANLMANEAAITERFGVTPQDIGVNWLPLNHDMGLIGMALQPLYVGMESVFFSPNNFIRDPILWLEKISLYKATVCGAPNFAYDLCVERITPERLKHLRLNSWRVAFNGAEPVQNSTLDKFQATFSVAGFDSRAFFPCYGMAETTLFVSGPQPSTPTVRFLADKDALEDKRVLPANAPDTTSVPLVACGHPASETHLRIVDPDCYQPLPDLTIGEIWISSPSVARGYLNRPEENKATFGWQIPGEKKRQYMRSGDLGFMHQGKLFIAGRLKDLIIIRGRNYFPQDLESTASQAHPDLYGDAAAFSVEHENQEQLVLVLAVKRTAMRSMDPEAIAQAVRSRIQAQYQLGIHALALIKQGVLPKTTSGKVQRRRCRTMFTKQQLPYLALLMHSENHGNHVVANIEPSLNESSDTKPLTVKACQRLVALVTRQSTDAIDLDQSLNAMGMDSLSLINLQHRFEATFSIPISLETLMEGPSIRELVAGMAEKADTATRSLTKINTDTAPLSLNQQTMWFLQQLSQENTSNHLATVVNVNSPLDVPSFRRALETVVEQHPSLRAKYETSENQTRQVFQKRAPSEYMRVENALSWSKQQCDAFFDALVHTPFDLENGPIFRVGLLKVAANHHILGMVFHHIAVDFWSLQIILGQLAEHYAKIRVGQRPQAKEASIHYAHFVTHQQQWLEAESGRAAASFWQQYLANATPVLGLPTDFPRPAIQRHEGAQLRFHLKQSLAHNLQRYCKRVEATPFTVLLSAYFALLNRHTNQTDLLVGTPAAARPSGFESVVGYVANPVVIRAQVNRKAPFQALVSQVQSSMKNVLANQYYPFQKLVEQLSPERDPSRSPIYQTLFSWQKPHILAGSEGFVLGDETSELTLGDLTLTPYTITKRNAQFDISLTLVSLNDGIGGAFEFNTDLFQLERVQSMAQHFNTLLTAALEQPNGLLRDMPIMADAERHALLTAWQGPSFAVPLDSLPDQLATTASRTPDRIAVVANNHFLSYDQLQQSALRVSYRLASQGTRLGDYVGLHMSRTVGMLACMMGIMRSGAAYVPLDPTFPGERLRAIESGISLSAIITDQHTIDLPFKCPLDRTLSSVELLQTKASEHYRPPSVSSDQMAYLIFTSGSTGIPKGVRIRHRSVLNLITTMIDRPGYNANDILCAVASISFDLSVLGLFLPQRLGACQVLATEMECRDGHLLTNLLNRHLVTVMEATPTTWQMLIEADWSGAPRMRIHSGGEALTTNLAQQLVHKGKALWNLYGPTETTVWSTVQRVEPKSEMLSPRANVGVGRPMGNTQVYLLDPFMQPVPKGVLGALYIGGAGQSAGYHRMPGLTAQTFVPNPFAQQPGERLYDTGDIMMSDQNHHLHFLERRDHQVKLRGYRIELGEIESLLNKRPGISRAAVILRQENQHKQLAAYVEYPQINDDGKRAEEQRNLHEYLSQKLPGYMVPSSITILAKFPLNRNGKLDRGALPAPVSMTLFPKGRLPETTREKQMVALWQDILAVEPITMEASFFELGGHSIMATRLLNKIRDTFGATVALKQFFLSPTPARLMAMLPEDGSQTFQTETSSPQLVPDESARHAPFPLTDLQAAYRVGRATNFPLGGVATHLFAIAESPVLDPLALQGAIDRLVQRHDMLRAVFRSDNRQQVLPQVPTFPMTIIDLRGLPDACRNDCLHSLYTHLSHLVLNPDKWPLFHVDLVWLPEGIRTYAGFDALTVDGRSIQIILDELRRFYHGDDLDLPPMTIQFRDYVQHLQDRHQRNDYQKAKTYWQQRIPDMPLGPRLPLAKDPATFGVPRFQRMSHRIDAHTWSQIKTNAGKAGITPSCLLLTVFAEVLAAWSAEPDFTLNVTLFDREPVHPQINDVVGDFTTVNLLSLTTAGSVPLRQRASQIQQQLWTDLENRAFNGVEVLREHFRVHRLSTESIGFPVVFTSLLESAGMDYQDPMGKEIAAITQTPQVYLDHQVMEQQSQLVFNWDFVADLFPTGLVSAMFAAFKTRITQCQVPHQLASITGPLLPDDQRAIREAINRTTAPFPHVLLHQPFIGQAKEYPDRTALVQDHQMVTYGALFRTAKKTAHLLLASGHQPGDRVAVVMEKSADQIAATLAILLADGVYLPIDPATPLARQTALYRDAGCRLVLTKTQYANVQDWPSFVQPIQVAHSGATTAEPRAQRTPHQLAYIIFTSGSTGKPKGVAIEHRGAVNTIFDINSRFGVHHNDKVLGLSALNFDLSVYDIFGLLAAGGSLVLPHPDQRLEPAAWDRLLRNHHISLWNTVPALMDMLTDYQESQDVPPDYLRLIMMSGDWIPLKLPTRIHHVRPKAAVYSLGGATEASIWSILFPIEVVDPQWASIPYGRPMVNQTMHVLDANLNPSPVWVPGDLFIGGIGLARCYWGDEEKTKHSFFMHPRTGERLYRTGDKGRYLPDGNIEFLGRVDQQVKIRGFRIELGEIEYQLNQLAVVGRAVAAVHREPSGSQRLVAYLTPVAGQPPESLPSEGELHNYLADHLPDYMLPNLFMALDELPLTANGKIDRKRLPAPAITSNDEQVLPDGEVPQQLLAIFRELLQAPGFGFRQNFFDAGGDSLIAMRAIAAINQKFGTELSLRQIFRNPTIADIFEAIKETAQTESSLPAIEPADRNQPLPLSYSQARLWFIDQLEGPNDGYNLPFGFTLSGPISAHALEYALQAIGRRHEVLRTVFMNQDGHPQQSIHTDLDISLRVIDLQGLPAQARKQEARRLADAEATYYFDLAKGPLWRASLVLSQFGHYQFLLTKHHIVSDGWSLGIMAHELEVYYQVALFGGESLPPLTVQYADYAAWQRKNLANQTLKNDLDYWRNHLADAPMKLKLPSDYPRPPRKRHQGQTLHFRLNTSLTAKLERTAKELGTTLFSVLYAGYAYLLARYSHESDILVGTPIANRNRTEVESLIGFFLNTLVLRFQIGPNEDVGTLIRKAHETNVAALSHGNLPFDHLVEALDVDRDIAFSPIFQVFFILQNAPMGQLRLPAVEVALSRQAIMRQFDLTLVATKNDGHLDMALGYDTDLYKTARIKRMQQHLTTLWDQFAQNHNQALTAIQYTSPQERREILETLSQAAASPIPAVGFDTLFTNTAARVGDAVAIIDGTNRISYAALSQAATAVAAELRALGIRSGANLAIHGKRGHHFVTAMLAALHVGAPIIALDPTLPIDRAQAMIASRCQFVVCTEPGAAEHLREQLPQSIRVVQLSTPKALLCGPSLLPTNKNLDQLAFLIFTSGSTGHPKGVMLHHRGMINHMFAKSRDLDLGAKDIIAQTAPQSWVIFIWQSLTAFIHGAATLIIDRETGRDAQRLTATLTKNATTILEAVPSLLHNVVEDLADRPLATLRSLRILIPTGEALPPELCRRWFNLRPQIPLLNAYGPSECSDDITHASITASPAETVQTMPIGRPILNFQTYLLDQHLHPVPIGVDGQVFAAGPGLARGYADDPAKTAEVFIPNPFANDGSRLYRTGDLARMDRHGNLRYSGRVDFQMKVRGVRVEPAEIEGVLSAYPGIREAIVILSGPPNQQQLTAFYTLTGDTAAPSHQLLRNHLGKELVEAMVPNHFIELDRMPLNPNGKTDRAALKKIQPVQAAQGQGSSAPQGEMEQLVAMVWCECLNQPHVGRHDNFFDLGGHSLLAGQVLAQLRNLTGIDLDLKSIFASPSVAQLARCLRQGPVDNLQPITSSDHARPPLSFAQRRLWFLERLEGAGAHFNLPADLAMTGPLSLLCLERATQSVVARHEAMRTTIREQGTTPYQFIGPPNDYSLPMIDLSSLPTHLLEQHKKDLARRFFRLPFNLTAGPLFRTMLIREAATHHHFMVSLHHIIADVWSMAILIREMTAAYRNQLLAHPIDETVPTIQYRDFAIWQQKVLDATKIQQQLDHFKHLLTDAPTVLDLPTDHPYPPRPSFSGGLVMQNLDQDIKQAFDGLGREYGATAFMLMLSAWATLLIRYANQPSVVIGVPVANRDHEQTKDLIGLFVNTLAIHLRLDNQTTFSQLTEQTRRTTLSAFEHGHLPFEKLVEALQPVRRLDRHPIYQVAMAYQNIAMDAWQLPLVSVTANQVQMDVAKLDLHLSVFETNQGFHLVWEYNRDVFEAKTISAMSQHFEHLCQQIIQAPKQPLWQLPLLNAEERTLVLDLWNQSPTPSPPFEDVVSQMEAQVYQQPDATALFTVQDDVVHIQTYACLWQRGKDLAAQLRAFGTQPGAVVGVCLTRGPDLVASILGILAIDAVYLPLDPQYPSARLSFMISETGISTLVGTDKSLDALSAQDLMFLQTLMLDEPLPAANHNYPRRQMPANRAAYIIYTSGSTGLPKGVVVGHHGLIRMVNAQIEAFESQPWSRTLAAASPNFDASISEIFVALCSGATLVYADPSQALAGSRLQQRLTDLMITHVTLTPSIQLTLHSLPAQLRVLVSAGEAFREDTFARHGQSRRYINAYGPTEATVCASLKVVDQTASPSIGGPINHTKLFVVDPYLNPQPIGIPGQLAIEGTGLAHGYLGRPGLTAIHFVPNPFANENTAGSRLYLSGDLVRRFTATELYYIGRKDNQVKVRGQRIETGEIEARLDAHPEIRSTAVITVPAADGQQDLLAIIESEHDLNYLEPRQFLKQQLPDFMIPHRFHVLATMPRNNSGKLDRSQLPTKVHVVEKAERKDAQTPTEKSLLAIWQTVLEDPNLGITDHFFEIGGHSLLAIQLVAAIRDTFDIDLQVDAIFAAPTVQQLAHTIDQQSKDTPTGSLFSNLQPVARVGALPLSYAQQRLWFLDQMEGASATYNVHAAVRAQGRLRPAYLEASVSRIIQRHEALRTCIDTRDGFPVQRIDGPSTIHLPIIDLHHHSNPWSVAHTEIDKAKVTPFQLTQGPLIRLYAYRVADEDHVLLIVMHHIISDAWSLDIFIRELAYHYADLIGEIAPALPELTIQYADYAVHQRQLMESGQLEDQRRFWVQTLAETPTRHNIPTDKPRPAVQTTHADAVSFVIPAKDIAGLTSLQKELGITTFMAFDAILAMLITRYSGQKQVNIGTPTANREARAIEPLIGFFVNTLVIANDFRGEWTFATAVERVRQTCLQAYAHQTIPFDQVVEAVQPERDLSHPPLFQIMLALQNKPRETLDLPGLTFTPIESLAATAKFDVLLTLIEVEDKDGPAYKGLLEFNSDLFETQTMERWGRHFCRLIRAVIADPFKHLADYDLMDEDERNILLHRWHHHTESYPDQQNLPELAANRAAASPDQILFAFDDLGGGKPSHFVTRKTVNERAGRLAGELAANGVKPDNCVGLSCLRSTEMAVGIYAIHKVGAAYVPLDPDLPIDRVLYMIQDANCAALLVDKHGQELLEKVTPPTIMLDPSLPNEAWRAPEISRKVPDTALAHVIYTSGSTGRPKGAMNTHAAVRNRVQWMHQTYGMNNADAVIQKTPFSFDVSVWEFLWPSFQAGRMVIAKPTGHNDPIYLAKLIRNSYATKIHFVPTMLKVFLDEVDDLEGSPLRQLFCSGEALLPEHVSQCRRQLRADLHNLYGPTEAAVDVSYWNCADQPAHLPVPIGHGIANVNLHVVDTQLRLVPLGVPGELLIGGIALARGYLADPSRTAAQFIPNPFTKNCLYNRLYKTGDLVRLRDDGAILFMGRLDFQIKIRGLRVELGEIETALTSPGYVADGIVLLRRNPAGGQSLVAYVRLSSDQPDDWESDLREQLHRQLPTYMLPDLFVPIEAFPVTTSGKVDRKKLPEPSWINTSVSAPSPPATPVEEQLASIWARFLNRDQVGRDDNFFAMGGDSITAIRVVAHARQIGIHIDGQQIFRHQTIRQLAASAVVGQLTEAVQDDITGAVPLTPIQRWFLDRHWPNPAHFNQAVWLDIPTTFTAMDLQQILGKLARHHDSLRLCFEMTAEGWRQWHAAYSDELPFRVVPQSGETWQFMPHELDRYHQEIQLTRGHIWNAVLFQRKNQRDMIAAQRLLLIVHHLAIDVVSWMILLDQFQSLCAQKSASQSLTLPPKSTAFRDYARALQDLAQSQEFDTDYRYWTDPNNYGSPKAGRLPLDNHPARSSPTMADSEWVEYSLPEDLTTSLFEVANRAYNTRPEELFLAAIGKALCLWTGRDKVRIHVESNGRVHHLPGIDTSRTVGWFTAIYPLCLYHEEDLAEQIIAIKEAFRAVPRQGIGYGVLKATNPSSLPESDADMLVNFLGRQDADQHIADLDPAATGQAFDPQGRRDHLWDLSIQAINGKGQLTLRFDRPHHHRDTMTHWLETLVGILAEMAEHCNTPAIGAKTPSDYPLAQLDQPTLNHLTQSLPHDQPGLEDLYPLTPIQHGLMLYGNLYNQVVSFQIEGKLDQTAYRRAWSRLGQRHPALRTGIYYVGLPTPLQAVYDDFRVPWHFEDWQQRAPQQLADDLQELFESESRFEFSLHKPPLMRLHLIQLAPDRYRFIWCFHHVILDGWSLPIIFQEVFTDYANLRNNRNTALPTRRPPADYMRWLQNLPEHPAAEFWQSELARVEEPSRIEPFSTREDVPQEQRELHLELTPAQSRELAKFADMHHLTLNTLLQAAWTIVLARYTRDDQVVFGATVSGRNADLTSMPDMIGCYINTIPVFAKIPSAQSILHWMKDQQERHQQRVAHAFQPLGKIHDWSPLPKDTPLFETLMVFENYPIDASLQQQPAGLTIGDFEMCERTNYPLAIAFMPGRRIRIRGLYKAPYFHASAVDALLNHIVRTLQAITADPTQSVHQLPMLTEQERETLLSKWNKQGSQEVCHARLEEMIAAQAAAAPERVALVHHTGDCPPQMITYRQLLQVAQAVAIALLDQGVGPRTVVGICCDNKLKALISILATHLAGGAYLPLDPTYPFERLRVMVEDAKPRTVLVDPRGETVLKGVRPTPLLIDAILPTIASQTLPLQEHRHAQDDLAYLMYTSGTTGRPKGVAVSHRGLAYLGAFQRNMYQVMPQTRVMQFASLSFDASAWEITMALTNGATLVCAEAALTLPGQPLYKMLKQSAISHITLPPSSLTVMPQEPLPQLVNIVVAGESCPKELVQYWSQGRRFFNAYGPTEFTVCGTSAPLTSDLDAVTIGTPIPHASVYIVDHHCRLSPPGSAGELLLGGPQLAMGYHQRPALTATRFIPNPYANQAGARLYRTGDLARHDQRGHLHFLGRIDHQVKLRGFRIELGEIDAILRHHSQVAESSVVFHGQGNNAKLIAYVGAPSTVTEPALESLKNQLWQSLKTNLPAYMMPATLLILPHLPRNTNGKLARRQLPIPSTSVTQSMYTPPQSETQKALAEIWAQVLKVERVGLDDNFFDLGGHSLLVTEVVSRIYETFGIDLPLKHLMEEPTVQGVSELIDAAKNFMDSTPETQPTIHEEEFEI